MVVLDIHLPGKSGIELLKYIKKAGRFCWILMITNQADEYYRRSFLRPAFVSVPCPDHHKNYEESHYSDY
jgi:response regulator of citrate/malate metabolism